MRLLLLTTLGIALVACSRTPSNVRDETVPAPSRPPTAGDLEREVGRLVAEHGAERAFWPGFDPLAIPLAVYDGERTVLFRHPSPPEGFVPAPDAGSSAHAHDGRHEAIIANTSVELGGVSTATFLLDQVPPGYGLTDLAAVAIHEAFHAHQRAHHPDWIANEADLFTYPTGSAELLAFQRMEAAALHEALAADSLDAAGCWARRSLALREDRYARMAPAFAAYERGTELNEGLATYVEMRAAGRDTVARPATEFGPADVRRRAYASGAALALLLDRLAPDWQTALATGEAQTLDAALAAALGAGKTCAFDAATTKDAEAKARADIAALAAERSRRLAEFEASPGWRVVIEAAHDGALLRPQGLDPLNVVPLDARRTLHARFLRLGNDAGHMVAMNAASLTEGAGTHPLFDGVRRVTLTGLAEPQVHQAEDKVTVQAAPGLDLAFDDATVEHEDGVVTVRLGR
ncbi:hypothetical protein [Marilutibacter chinensis]|uniref:Lipoprotein n=1 Tax=Marilutibacter chinensis TaxID=2912247 RepID=A0ABS9HVK5_9GAMM|nr:hypothetical protein [Lysobacter chinensis]MCF7222929.1 hypothetical protein [Lysobacter chinensis]